MTIPSRRKKQGKVYKEIWDKRVFVIRESHKWKAGITHSGLAANLMGEDKTKEKALIKLCNILYEKLIKISQDGKERYF